MPAEEKGAFWRRRVAKIVNEDNKRALKTLSEEKESIVEFKQTYHENALDKYLNLLGYMDASIEYILNTTDKQQKAVDRQKIENVFKNLISKTAETVENSEISQEAEDSVIEPSIQNSEVKISEDMALDTL
jgi:nitrogen fixation/metabolism regulation signal transduction histidine kinase